MYKVYDFICSNCKEKFEDLAEDNEVIYCPICNNIALQCIPMNRPTHKPNPGYSEIYKWTESLEKNPGQTIRKP